MSNATDRDDLEGLSPATCFLMGAEWERFRAELRTGEQFAQHVHVANLRRLRRVAKRQGRCWRVREMGAGMAAVTVGRRQPAEILGKAAEQF